MMPERLSPPSFCSQPTYEELKLSKTATFRLDCHRSQPTYEELKPVIGSPPFFFLARSQPTYEELKLLFPDRHAMMEQVLSLPMRN